MFARPQIATDTNQAHLKRIQSKGEKDFNVAQNASCLLICSKNEYDFMNPKQRYKGKCCLGKPTKDKPESRTIQKEKRVEVSKQGKPHWWRCEFENV